jgi:hypothetical protein
MAITYIKIASATVTAAGGQSAIEFTSIPTAFDDLVLWMSARSTGTNANAQGFCYLRFNDSVNDFSSRRLIQDGTGVASDSGGRFAAFIPNSSATASTFGTMVLYVPNYRSSVNKSYSIDQGMENNSTTNYLQGMSAGLWSNTTAINAIKVDGVIDSNGSPFNFAQHSTAVLYGILKA